MSVVYFLFGLNSEVLPNYFSCIFLYLTMIADLPYSSVTFALKEYSPT